MSDPACRATNIQEIHLRGLPPETHAALARSARANGRSIHEEAEDIIKTHLATFGEDDD